MSKGNGAARLKLAYSETTSQFAERIVRNNSQKTDEELAALMAEEAGRNPLLREQLLRLGAEEIFAAIAAEELNENRSDSLLTPYDS